jgi:hypothetical protein
VKDDDEDDEEGNDRKVEDDDDEVRNEDEVDDKDVACEMMEVVSEKHWVLRFSMEVLMNEIKEEKLG